MATFSLSVNAAPVQTAFAAPHIPPFYDYVRQRRRRSEMAPLNAVVARCNKFTGNPDSLFKVYVLDNSSPIGLMLPEYVKQMNWDNTSFDVSMTEKTVRLCPKIKGGEDVVAVCGSEFIQLCKNNVDNFTGFKKWFDKRKDFHPVRGVDDKFQGLQMPAPLRGVLGIITTGVHMNMYTIINGQIHVWVSKRTANVTYANKLDQVVAGAMDPVDAMDPLATLKREAEEEAGLVISLPDGAVTKDRINVGTVVKESTITFYDEKDHVAGSEAGHLEPGIRFTYDLLVPPGFQPTPTEPESIAGFFLKSADEVKEDLKCEEWKPNCGLVMLDFLLRHGELKEPEDVECLKQIRKELQPKLPLPLGKI